MTEREIEWRWLLQREHLLPPRTARYVNDLVHKPRDAEKADVALAELTTELRTRLEGYKKWPEIWASDRVSIRISREGEWVTAYLVDEPSGEVLAQMLCGRAGESTEEKLLSLKRMLSAMKLAHQIWSANQTQAPPSKPTEDDEIPF